MYSSEVHDQPALQSSLSFLSITHQGSDAAEQTPVPVPSLLMTFFSSSTQPAHLPAQLSEHRG